ncbi:MAG: DivIVA domain-containing protein [Cyclobacteriaceae bacterium]|nr:DivIVA domain-containing protein [Cyclobacteriaceae bacterium]
MKITPLEIRQKTFEKVFRGYDKDEVSAFLTSLSQEWERLIDDKKDLHLRIESLEKEVKKLHDVESSLFRTLKTAEDTGANLIEQAKKETELKIKESSLKSDEILGSARDKAKKLMHNAEVKTRQILEEMLDRVKALETQYHQLYDLREELIGQIKQYSEEVNERVEKFEKKSEEGTTGEIVIRAKEIFNSAMMDVYTILNKEVEKQEQEKVENQKKSGDEPIKVEEAQRERKTPEDIFKRKEEDSKKQGDNFSSSSGSFFDKLE